VLDYTDNDNYHNWKIIIYGWKYTCQKIEVFGYLVVSCSPKYYFFAISNGSSVHGFGEGNHKIRARDFQKNELNM
jgi:hypothetical protein